MRAAAAPAQTPIASPDRSASRSCASESAQARTSAAPRPSARLTVLGDDDAGLLPRALETLLRRGAAPRSVDARLNGEGWRIALEVDGVLQSELRHIAGVLNGLVGVRVVTVEAQDGQP